MRAFRVMETGEVLHPVRMELDEGEGMGDGLALADPDSPEALEWAMVTEPMPEDMRPLLEELRAEKAKQAQD